MKARVHFQFTVSGYVDVDVMPGTEDPEQAAGDIAIAKIGKPTTYAGNGSICGLVGMEGKNIGLSASPEVEIEGVELP